MRKPVLIRSSGQAWVASATLSFSMKQLLMQAPQDFTAPEIYEIGIFMDTKVNTAAANTFKGITAAQQIARVRLTDLNGDRVNVGSASLRQINQREYGAGQKDPADIAASQTNATEQYVLKIPFAIRRLASPLDTCPPASDFDRGDLQVSLAPALVGPTNNQGTTQSGTVTVWTLIYDAGTRRAKSRLTYRDYGVNGQDYPYTVDGLLFDMWLSAGNDAITAGTALSATNFTSGHLEYQSFPNVVLDDYYRRQLFSLATNDDVSAGVVQNFFCARREQKITELPAFDYAQMRFDVAAPSSGIVVVTAITTRSLEMSARALRVSPLTLARSQAVIAAPSGAVHASSAGVPIMAQAFLPVTHA